MFREKNNEIKKGEYKNCSEFDNVVLNLVCRMRIDI